MTYQSIVSSLWVWGAASVLGAFLGLVVWSLLRMVSETSRDHERAEAEAARLEMAAAHAAAIARLKAECQARRRERV